MFAACAAWSGIERLRKGSEEETLLMAKVGKRSAGVRTAGLRAIVLGLAFIGLTSQALAQRHAMDVPEATGPKPARTRLILRDGSYQVVLSYQVQGNVVRYRSAERNGSVEEIPVRLVDLPATEKWAHDHDPAVKAQEQRAPVLSPELQKEEADRAARTPEVASDLRLPEEISVVVLDTYNGGPELVPLPQDGGDLNHETAHNVLKGVVNPASSPHRILDLQGVKSDIQVHVPDPVFYVRVGSEEPAGEGSGLIVDTHGATSGGRSTSSTGRADNEYVIERLDVRSDTRVVDSFRIGYLGVKPQRDVIETNAEALPGGHWLKLKPVQPLDFGEYALVEVLSDREVNLGVWSFGVHPTARENVEAIHPEPKRPITLERRRRQ